MKNGAIVASLAENEKLYRVKGVINNKEGRKIAILEELCKCSASLKLEYLEALSLVWSPKHLKDNIEEYDVSMYDEEILIQCIGKEKYEKGC
ncbi:MAG: hypothetical protein ACOYVD_02850 [Bacillota bacterium]